jgi:internalin A
MKLNETQDLIREAKINNETSLVLSSKELTSLPREVLELNNLTQLSLSSNQLTSLPPEITELKNLTELCLNGNNLTSLPPEISELKNLTKLYISENELICLPSEISDLIRLTELDISNNRLTFLPSEISKLRNLKRLDIRNNQLITLPSEILELELDINWEAIEARGVFVGGNHFENPPMEVVKKGREAITNYFKFLEGEVEQLNELKVLFVGDGSVGKTSLINRLMEIDYNENELQTDGIDIKEWTVSYGDQKIKVNFWDFGGQEIMHATHQFFLSKRSLYILVLDSGKDRKIEYWLKLIENFGGDSPVLVVINKIDENPSFDLNRKFLKEKYSSIKGFYRVSCKKNIGIKDFKEDLEKEVTNAEYIKIKLLKNWFNVKTKLENMNCDFISYEEYEKMCVEEQIIGEAAQSILEDFLIDLGVLLHFKDMPLLDTYILEPEWITQAVYKIVNSDELIKRNGILEFNLLDKILRNRKKTDYYYPPSKYNYIVSLMKKFDLCYEINNHAILLPGLLDVQEPEFDFNYDSALKFIVQYDFLFKSVMPRFIVKMSRDIKNNLCWRTGVVLENKGFNSTAVIKEDDLANRVNIYVNGEQKRDYLAVILQKIREINNTLEKLEVVEKIPLPDEPNLTVSYNHLIKLENRGIDRYFPEGSDKEYSIAELLGTVRVPFSTIKSNIAVGLNTRFEETYIDDNQSLEERILHILKQKIKEHNGG